MAMINVNIRKNNHRDGGITYTVTAPNLNKYISYASLREGEYVLYDTVSDILQRDILKGKTVKGREAVDNALYYLAMRNAEEKLTALGTPKIIDNTQ